MKTITREGIKRIVGPVSGSGGSRGAGGGDISLAGLASEAWVEENYISKAFFNRLFTIHSASGVIDPNDPDEEQTIDSIEALVGFWTEQYVSALGQNSGGGGGGGGGGVTLNQPLEAINNAGLSAPTTAGTMLVWYNGSWTYSPGARLQIGGITATGTVLVNSSVTANSFIKTGGTSSMFLKADGSVDTNTYASETWVSQNYVSIQFFETLFNAINAQGVKVNANSITGIDSIKAMFGLWTERYLSALGQNSGGGGGGGVTLNQPLSVINNAGLNAPGTAGSLLVWNGTTWTYSAAASIIATTATFYGNSYAAGFAVTNKDNTYVLLAGGGTKLLSELGGNTSVSYNGSVYSPSSGVVALGYLTTSVKINSSTYSVNSSGLVDIGSVVTAVKIAGTLTPYSPTAGVVEIPAYPTIPTNVSAFTNDAGYVSTSVSLSDPHLVLASPSGSGGPASFRALVASDIPDLSAYYATSDTWRTVQCNGVSIGNNTLNLVAGTNVAISASNGTLTFSSTDTNTLNTAGAVQLGSTKLYLVGAASQGDGVQTYSNVNCYIGTDGCLYSGGSKVQTEASGYLPLTGGTLADGSFSYPLTLKTTNTEIICLPLQINSSYKTQYGYQPSIGSYIYDYTNNNFIGISSQPFVIFNGNNGNRYNIFHQGSSSFINNSNGSSDFISLTAGGQCPYFRLNNNGVYLTDYSYNYSGILWPNVDKNFYIFNNATPSRNTGLIILQHGNNGNVAIGRTTADYKLHVDGYICGTNICIDGGTSTQFLKADGSVDSTNYASQTGATYSSSKLWLVGASAYNQPSSTTYTKSTCFMRTDGGLEVDMPTNSYYIVSTGGYIRAMYGYFDNYGAVIHNYTTYKALYLNNNGSLSYDGWSFSQNDSSNFSTLSTSNHNLTIDIGSATAIYGKLFQNTSDDRKKDIMNYVDLNLSAIAQAPIFNFTWKDYPGTRPSVGTSAQYWEKVLPYSVSEDQDGYLAMDYGATALAAAVLTARKVSEHEQRIAELERENKVLWNMIATLKAS